MFFFEFYAFRFMNERLNTFEGGLAENYYDMHSWLNKFIFNLICDLII